METSSPAPDSSCARHVQNSTKPNWLWKLKSTRKARLVAGQVQYSSKPNWHWRRPRVLIQLDVVHQEQNSPKPNWHWRLPAHGAVVFQYVGFKTAPSRTGVCDARTAAFTQANLLGSKQHQAELAVVTHAHCDDSFNRSIC